MNRIFSISNRSRANKAARAVFDGGASELRIVLSGEGAPSCELATAWFLPQGAMYRHRRILCQDTDRQLRIPAGVRTGRLDA